MITASLRLKVPEERRAEALRAMRLLIGPTRAQPGCSVCRLLHDLDEEDVLVYVEEWGTREQLERHLASEGYRRLLEVMELASEAPEIRFDTVSRRQGLELVEAVRTPRSATTN